MLIAASTTADGRRLLVIGLQAENVDRLLNDEPIYKRLDGGPGPDTEGLLVPGLEEWDIAILGPEDTVRFVVRTQPDRFGELG